MVVVKRLFAWARFDFHVVVVTDLETYSWVGVFAIVGFGEIMRVRKDDVYTPTSFRVEAIGIATWAKHRNISFYFRQEK